MCARACAGMRVCGRAGFRAGGSGRAEVSACVQEKHARARTRARVHTRACTCAFVRAFCFFSDVRSGVGTDGAALVGGSVGPCMSAHVRAFLHACNRATERACIHD